MSKKISRRGFLKLAGIGASSVGVTGAAALAGRNALLPAGLETGHLAAPLLRQTSPEDVAAMDAAHGEVVQIFLDNIGKDPAYWGVPLPHTMDGDTKVFEIVCQDVMWETKPGMAYPAMTYNGIVPGPEIRVTEGDHCRFIVKNEMAQSTTIHWHGVIVPNSQDGVGYVNQPPIRPGETFVYEFVARNPGSHMYHSHHNAAEQVSSGMLGAFIIEPKDKSREPVVDAEYNLILNDSTLGFTFNGREFPYTQPIIAKLGQKIRVRYFNEGFMIHPMHLHGIPQLVFAKDGWNLPAPYLVDTLNIAPGERYDVLIDCTEPGAWAFHCHILTHAESRHGMFGMVTALIVEA